MRWGCGYCGSSYLADTESVALAQHTAEYGDDHRAIWVEGGPRTSTLLPGDPLISRWTPAEIVLVTELWALARDVVNQANRGALRDRLAQFETDAEPVLGQFTDWLSLYDRVGRTST